MENKNSILVNNGSNNNINTSYATISSLIILMIIFVIVFIFIKMIQESWKISLNDIFFIN